MHRLRIAIDPLLRERSGPEICWTLRLLLSSLGYAWEEVPTTDPDCDLAYTALPDQAPAARMWLRACSSRWARPAAWQLAHVGTYQQCHYPRYADELDTALTCQTVNGQLRYQRDWLFDLFWLVTGQEESRHPRNKHGYLQLDATPWQTEQALRQALAASLINFFGNQLQQHNYPLPIPRWPYGKQAAACLSHDVDYPEIIRWLEPVRVIGRQGLAGTAPALEVLRGQRQHWHFHEWMALEEQLGTRSAFYFVARKGSLLEYLTGTPDSFYDIRAPQFRRLFHELRTGGWEIGLHGSYLAYTSQAKFAAEKQRLEVAANQAIEGHRHHYWHLDPYNPDATLLLHEQLGFRYDASLTNDHYLGWRRGLCLPYHPFHQQQRRELATLQMPTGWMDDQLFGQQARNPGERSSVLQALAQVVLANHGMLLVDVHDYVFDQRLFPGWVCTVRELWEYLRHQGSFWFATPGEVATYWAARYHMIVQASIGLAAGSAIRANTTLHTRISAPTSL